MPKHRKSKQTKDNLLEACAKGAAHVASKILSSSQAKIALGLRDNHNWTPLHHAVHTNAIDCVRVLLSHITVEQIRAESWEGETALFIACQSSEVSLEIIGMLLDKDAELVLYVNNEWVSPLQKATEMGRLDIVELLLKNGAPINHPDLDEETALFYAIRDNNPELILYLASVPECDLHHRNDRNLDVINLYMHMHFGHNYNGWKYNKPITKRMQDDLIINTIIQLRSDDMLGLDRIVLSDQWFQFFHNCAEEHRFERFFQSFLYAFKESHSYFNSRLTDSSDRIFWLNFTTVMTNIFIMLFESFENHWLRCCTSYTFTRADILLILFDIFQMNRFVFDAIFHVLMAGGYTWYGFETGFVQFLHSSLNSMELPSITSLTEFISYSVPFGLMSNELLDIDKPSWTQYCSNTQFGYRILEDCQQKALFAYLPFVTVTEKCFVLHDFVNTSDEVPTLKSLCRQVIRYRLLSTHHRISVSWLFKNCFLPKEITDFLRYNYCGAVLY